MTERDWENFFQIADFDPHRDSRDASQELYLTPRNVVHIANALIREELEKADKVYGGNGKWAERGKTMPGDFTWPNEARLVAVKRLGE